MNDEERSAGGSRIYRYDKPVEDGKIAIGDQLNLEAISGHITRQVGPIEMVYHEIVSTTVHVDIHHVAPTEQHEFNTLVTSGMSDRRMVVPEGLEDLAFAEVVALLPPEWPLGQQDFKDEANYWPLRLLKVLARFPHEYSTWLGADHTMPNGDPPEPYADNTGFSGVLLTSPVSLPEEFFTLEVDKARKIQFFVVVPLYADEMDLKLEKGADALFDLFEEQGVSDVIDITRKSVCTPGDWLC